MKTSLLFLFLSSLAGCASTGEITELQKFSGTVDQHKKVVILLKANSKVEKDNQYRERFGRILAKAIAKTELFDHVGVNKLSGATLKLLVQFNKISEPNDLTSVFANSLANSEIEVTAILAESTPAIRKLSSLTVTGNSKQRGRSTVGGIGVTEATDYTETAMEEAADRIAHYLVQHSRKAEK